MGTKMLTDIARLETQYATQELYIESTFLARQQAYNWFKQQGVIILRYHSLPQINVQRLMSYIRVFEIVRRLPILAPEDKPKAITKALLQPSEEEKLLTKKLITRQDVATQQIQRRETVRLEKWLQEVQERLLSPVAISLTDHTELCMLDKLLIDSEPTIVPQILQQLLALCEQKAKQIPRMVGYEALQKQLLQVYIPMFMTFPYTLNMLSLRISTLTMQLLLHKNVQLYYTGAFPTQAMKPKYQLLCCEKRRIETKAVSSGSTTRYVHPHKFNVAETEDFTGTEKIGYVRGYDGKDLKFMMLRYAYSMPYWLRRFVAIHMGMPENSKYALYFGIGGLPTRRARWKRDFLKHPEVKYLQFSRDEHIMNLIRKYTAKRRAFYSSYKRYYRTKYENKYGRGRCRV